MPTICVKRVQLIPQCMLAQTEGWIIYFLLFSIRLRMYLAIHRNNRINYIMMNE